MRWHLNRPAEVTNSPIPAWDQERLKPCQSTAISPSRIDHIAASLLISEVNSPTAIAIRNHRRDPQTQETAQKCVFSCEIGPTLRRNCLAKSSAWEFFTDDDISSPFWVQPASGRSRHEVLTAFTACRHQQMNAHSRRPGLRMPAGSSVRFIFAINASSGSVRLNER